MTPEEDGAARPLQSQARRELRGALRTLPLAGLWLPLVCAEGERECLLEPKGASLRVKGCKGILAEACA